MSAASSSRCSTTCVDVRAARIRQHRDPRCRAARRAAAQGRDRQGGLRRQAPRCGRFRARRAGTALRPDRPVRAVRPGERRQARVPVPPLADPEGVAGRAPTAGPLPRVHPGRHRHRRPRRAAVPLRRRGRACHGRGAGRSAHSRRPRCRSATARSSRASTSGWVSPIPPPSCRSSTSSTRCRPRRSPSCSWSRDSTEDQADRSSPWPRSSRPTRRSSSESSRSASSTRCSPRASSELAQVVEGASGVDGVVVTADLRIARGLDYYTGTVFETRLEGWEHLGSICSGGRYDQLAQDKRSTYPGVGISLGVSRLLVPLGAHRRRAPCRRSCSSRSTPRTPAPPATRSPGSYEPAASPPRSRPRPTSSASRSSTPSDAGIPYVWFPAVVRAGTSARVSRSTPTRAPGHRPPTTSSLTSSERLARSRTRDPHPRRRKPARRRHRPAGHPRRMGGPSTRSRRRRVHRPARGLRRRPGGRTRGGRAPAAGRVLPQDRRDGAAAPRRQRERRHPHRRHRGHRRRRRDPQRCGTPAVPDRRRRIVECGLCRRGGPPQVPLPRPAPHRTRRGHPAAQQGQRRSPRGARGQGLRRDRDADSDPLDARGCARLPRAGPPQARQLVRPAAEPAAVQAAADGRRHGALLPDRALLPRRGLPRRPPAGVHPARHRDELRRAGRRARAHGADPRQDVVARSATRSRRRSRT